MIIVSAADEKFVPHFATMMHSAWTHNPEAEFYLLDCGIKHETWTRLKTFADRIGAHLGRFSIKLDQFVDLPTTAQYSAAVYGRLHIPDLFRMPRGHRSEGD